MASPLILLAILGGVLPALLWLAFWLMEDRCQPEPKRYIIFVFFGGAIAVFIALWMEQRATAYFEGTALLLVWATIEELLKFGAAYFIALRTSVFDEPLDALIYMVTAALGFSAFENVLFLLTPLQNGDVFRTIITGDLRFIGASLLHSLSSATIGIALAFAFYKSVKARRMAAVVGVVLAILLHTLFNFFILGTGGDMTFWIFLCIWFGIVVVLFLTEQIKQPSRDFC